MSPGRKNGWRKLLKPLVEQGVITLKWAEDQTWQYLQNEMREGQWHVFHFIGHGGFDPEADEGYIALADKDGKTDRLYAQQLARPLPITNPLAWLCSTAAKVPGAASRTSSQAHPRFFQEWYSGSYCNAVPISDEAAIVFSGSFYDSLADGYPIDASMAEARKAMRQVCKGTVEWGTRSLPAFIGWRVVFHGPRRLPHSHPGKHRNRIPIIPAVPVPAEPHERKPAASKNLWVFS